MTNKTLPKWNADREQVLVQTVGTDYDVEVSVETVAELAETLETTSRSVASKLRKMGYSVESSAASREKTFDDATEAKLRNFVESNPGKYTYSEIAAYILDDANASKRIQGKLLSMELTDKVKKAEPKLVLKKYTEAEAEVVQSMMEAGAYLEDIAEAVGKTLASVRGKALAINKATGIAIPKQKQSYAETKSDAFDTLTNIAEMTVAEIATALDKSERGVKSMLTHRGITCSDYNGAKRAEKNAAKRAEAAA